MEGRHPAGYDPESFRRAAADTIRIPRRPPKSTNPPPSRGPPQSNSNSPYGTSSAFTPRKPLGRSSRDRMASPAYVSLVAYPGIDESIRRLAHLARFFDDNVGPSTEFLDTVDTLSTRFIEHVAAERGAQQKKALKNPSLPRPREVIPEHESNSRKRRRAVVVDSSDSGDSAPRKRIRSSRPRRSLRQVRYSDQDGDADLDNAVPAQRSVLPRRSKENMSSLHEDILAAKTRPPVGRVIDVESEHRSNNAQKPYVTVDPDTDDDTSDGESDDSWVMPVVRPLRYVRDRPLVSDRTSLTPVDMDDDIDTDAEERKVAARKVAAQKVAAQKERMALEARRRRAMEQMSRARSNTQQMGAGRVPPVQKSQPHGVRLYIDSVIVPIRGKNIPANSRSIPSPCYHLVNMPMSAPVCRQPPRCYNRDSAEVSNPRRNDRSTFDNSGQPLEDQDAPRRISAQTPHDTQAIVSNEDKEFIEQAWNEFFRLRGPGSAVRILPRADQAAVHAQPVVGDPSQQLSQQVAAAAPTSWNNVAPVSQLQGNVPSLLQRDIAFAMRSMQQPNALQGNGGVYRQNGTLMSHSPGGATMQNGTMYPNVTPRENGASGGPALAVNPNAIIHGVHPGLYAGNYASGNERRVVRSQPPGSIDSSLGTLDIPRFSRKPHGPHSQRSTPSTLDLNMHQSLPSPVTPVQALEGSVATQSGMPGNQMLTQGFVTGGIPAQSALNPMHLNGISSTMQGGGDQLLSNVVQYAGGAGGYHSRRTAYAGAAQRHLPLPTSMNGAATGNGGCGPSAGQMNRMTATQHHMVNQNHRANFPGQHAVPYQLIQSAVLNSAPNGVPEMYRDIYERAYRELFARRRREMEAQRRMAEQRRIAEQRERAGEN
eukprot:GFKZ01015465.1.p1 GENE.GFKZ01015465.1~~GFKZ01015465.1.p1  ORF type:complete len:877 (+),score=97.90 GFKZ01015465.1:143-2773(+)